MRLSKLCALAGYTIHFSLFIFHFSFFTFHFSLFTYETLQTVGTRWLYFSFFTFHFSLFILFCTFAPELFINITVKLSKEAKTAIIILLGVASFIFGYNFLKSTPLFSTDRNYHAVFTHSGGLQTGTNVTVNGVSVGAVKDIKIDPRTAKIVVSFSCKKDFTFSKNSKAEIYSSLLGNTGLQILPALDGATPAQPGDTIPSSIQASLMDAIGANLEPTAKNLNKVLNSVDSLMITFSHTLDAKAQKDIKESLANLNVTLQNMNKASVSLNNILASSGVPLQKSLTNVHTISENFVHLSDSLSKIQVGKLVAHLEGTLSEVNGLLQQIEKGNGTISKLLNDPKLYNNLQTATSELGLLMEDIRLNPKRYVHISVFGKKNQAYETPQTVEPSISERAEKNQK